MYNVDGGGVSNASNLLALDGRGSIFLGVVGGGVVNRPPIVPAGALCSLGHG